jgi:hypothetical protein
MTQAEVRKTLEARVTELAWPGRLIALASAGPAKEIREGHDIPDVRPAAGIMRDITPLEIIHVLSRLIIEREECVECRDPGMAAILIWSPDKTYHEGHATALKELQLSCIDQATFLIASRTASREEPKTNT